MWIREVDFPAALIDAHRSGRLVIFVGAGASMDPPASLPSFRTLTAVIAQEAQQHATDADLDHPDVFLGRLADRGFDVHRRVAAHIGVSTSKPNRLHEALVALTTAGGPVRIVTTNYDRHLSRALSELPVSVPFDEYAGPALPMGDDFTGIVYLHGNLRQEPRRLIVTDRDFGRAYLRDAWAARFVERMFATYTVLFVGYSHGDVVMRYLARALGAGAARYVLTSDPGATDWRPLGLHPIGYPLVDGSHDALVDAVEGWASRASMGLLDHRQLIMRLVAAPPSQIPEEASYMEATVADPQGVKLFTELARGQEWLSWAALQGEFRRLFDPSATATECTARLAYWFVEHFVMDETLTSVALGVVRDAGGRLGATLWSTIGHLLHVKGSPRPSWLGPWLALLVQNTPEETSDLLEYALVASQWPDDKAAALLLFDRLTEPQLHVARSFRLPGEVPRFDVKLRGSQHWLNEAWQKLFAPNMTQAAPDVLAIADQHLRQAFHALTATGSAQPGWDPVSFSRSAIEPHPQDRPGEAMDALIDAARDCLESLLSTGDALGAAYAAAWADSDVPILRRLALHGWTQRPDLDSTAKISWLRQRGWLFDHQLHHEVFRLMEVVLPTTDSDVADALVADVLAGPADTNDEELGAYQRFNTLAWIKRHAPRLQSALDAFEQVQSQHPDFAEREVPDLLARIEVGWVQPRPPMTVHDLHERITTNAADAIVELRRYENIEFPADGPRWSDALSLLVETVRDHPADGFAILDATGGDHPDIANGVISGWSTAPSIDTATAETIVNRLARLDLATVTESLSRLLAEGGQNDANPTKWFRIPTARQLAADLWSAISTGPPAVDVNDWLIRAINHPAGRLAQFWLHAVAADWREAGDQWTGLPPQTRTHLEILLASDDVRSAMAEVIFASQLLFYFGADRQWCQDHVLPLLDWVDAARARRAWDGYLTWGRYNDQLLTAGLLDHYQAAAIHLNEFCDERRRQYLDHLAALTLFSQLDVLPQILSFTATVEPAHRVEWMNHITWTLGDMPTEAVDNEWQRWMQQYWQNRLNSIPLQLTFDEASAMAAWVVHLTDPGSIGQGIDLATSHPAGLRRHAGILRTLNSNRIDNDPIQFAKLIAHLTRHTEEPFWQCHELAELVPQLRNKADTTDINTIIEQALRLGCSNATQW